MRSEQNLADKHLVVGSIEVLGDVKSGATMEIKKSIDAVKNRITQINRQTEKWWNDLTSDSVITPMEKKILRREYENIKRSQAAVTLQVEALGYEGTAMYAAYIQSYTDLCEYLEATLHLFNEMEADTHIDDIDAFNEFFSDYYYAESLIMIALNLEIISALNFRVLDNLNEQGTTDEIAFYKGGIYMYVDGAWKNIATGNYLGVKTEIVAAEQNGVFFLAGDDFTVTDKLYVNGSALQVNGEDLYISRKYLKGYIYYYADGDWMRENNKRDYKYTAAFADVINVTGELPALFQAGLDNLQDQITDLSDAQSATASSLEDEILARQGQYAAIADDIVRIDDDIDDILDELDSKVDHIPEYLGAQSSDPANPKEGDFYVYKGTTTQYRTNAKIYRYHNNAWEYLAANDSQNRNYYMMALKDILSFTDTQDGYFATLFADSFFSNDATMDSLSVRTIKLYSQGTIQSSNLEYIAETRGLKIDANGNIDANGSMHIKGPVAIGAPLAGNSDFNNYDVVIGTGQSGGRVKVKGHIEATSGSFSGHIEADSGSFHGELDCGMLRVEDTSFRSYLIHVFNKNSDFKGKALYDLLIEWNITYDDQDHTLSDIVSDPTAVGFYKKGIYTYTLSTIRIKRTEVDFWDGLILNRYYDYNIYFNSELIGGFRERINQGGGITDEDVIFTEFGIHQLTYDGLSLFIDAKEYEPYTRNMLWRDENGFLRIS